MTTALIVYQPPSMAIVPIGQPFNRLPARRERALSQIRTFIGTKPAIQIPPTSVASPFDNLPTLARQAVQKAMDRLGGIVAEYLSNPDPDHRIVGDAALAFDDEVRRIGRDMCGHKRRSFGGNKPLDRPVNPFARVSEIGLTTKEKSFRLRDLVRDMLDINLPDALRGDSALHGDWRYSLKISDGQEKLCVSFLRKSPTGWGDWVVAPKYYGRQDAADLKAWMSRVQERVMNHVQQQ